MQRDARTSNAGIGRQVGLATSGVSKRIKKLERAGVIRGYHASLDPRTFGLGLIAYLLVRTRERPGEIRAAKEIAAIPEVQEVHHAAGEDCYLVKLRTADPQALGRMLRDHVGQILSVESTRTIVVLETIKESRHVPISEGAFEPE